MNNPKTTNSLIDTIDGPRITYGASLAAIGLHSVLAQWSARCLSDGFLPLYVVDQLGTEELCDELVAEKIWTRTEDGFRIADWHREQGSAADLLAKRDVAAERSRRHRAKLAVIAVPEEAEEATADVVVKEEESEEPEPVVVAAAQKTRRSVSSEVPDLKDDGSDMNFDEFLDLMRTPPDDDRACWKAWVEVNKTYYAEDILDAADDYQKRVPRRKRALPEVWLSEHGYLRCAPFSTPVDLT